MDKFLTASAICQTAAFINSSGLFTNKCQKLAEVVEMLNITVRIEVKRVSIFAEPAVWQGYHL